MLGIMNKFFTLRSKKGVRYLYRLSRKVDVLSLEVLKAGLDGHGQSDLGG